MKLAQINATCGTGSTGKICLSISKLLSEKGHDNIIFYSQGKSDYKKAVSYMNPLEIKLGAFEARLRGNYGFNSRTATKRLVSALRKYDPDIIALHNLHGHNCCLDELFSYIKAENKKIVWTFHDCWAFTGGCAYYVLDKCDKWKNKCFGCPQAHKFSWFLDRSTNLFEKKKLLFQGLNLTIVTPSQWLADQVKDSFLKDYPVKVINNGIDLNTFKPTPSDFRQRYGIPEERFVVLGVAFGWGMRKGLDVFVELSKRLDDRFQIVLVGTDDNVDRQLPENIISIHRTQDQTELAQIYTAADVFVNPTREDTYPTVNMEAIACGTPVITFNTGGSPECIDEYSGVVVDCDDVDALEHEIKAISLRGYPSLEKCGERAAYFDAKIKFSEYIDLYEKVFDSSVK